MNKITVLLFALIAGTSGVLPAQKADWKEMHHFHEIMGSTFHPAEEGDLSPLKKEAGELVKRVKQWQQSKVPAGYKADVVKPILTRLVTQTEKVKKAVMNKKSDAELTKFITETHDIFHEIMEKCRD